MIHYLFLHQRHKPQPTPVTPPPISQPISTNPPAASSMSQLTASTHAGGWCIGYGYQSLKNGSYDMTQVDNDLAYLKSHGITCVRLAFYGQNADITKPVALAAKAKGFYVEIGNDGDPSGIDYAAGVIAEATWAQANHIDQVSIGNEASKDAHTQQALAALSCNVRKVYSGVISYDTYLATSGFDDIQAWAQNRGCLDKLGLNIYSAYASTLSEANSLLPGHWYISETNLDCDTGICAIDSQWASGLSTILNIERTYNVPLYVFAYSAGGDGVNPWWGIMGHPQVQAVLGL